MNETVSLAAAVAPENAWVILAIVIIGVAVAGWFFGRTDDSTKY
jgi:hypothetical protein